MDLWKLKREFLEHCEIERGQSVLTVDNYGRYIDRFLTWLESNKQSCHPSDASTTSSSDSPQNENSGTPPKESSLPITIQPGDISDESVRQYRLYINRLHASDGKELKATTQNHHILALRAFLRYLLGRGIAVLPPEKIALAKTGDRDINFLTEEEYQRFLNAPDTTKPEGLRDKAMLEVLFSTGMRISELVSTNLGQINFLQGEVAVLGKGKKLRVVFLSDVALKWLVEYLSARGVFRTDPKFQKESDLALKPSDKGIIIHDNFKKEPLFLSSRGNRINARAAERMVKKYSAIAGISKDISPHTLRHTFATDMLAAGADIRSVQSLLGHSNLSTTQIYTHVTDKHLREIHKRFHGKSNDVGELIN